MKFPYKVSLTAIALSALFGVTACGTTSAPTATNTEASQAVPSTEKDKSFTTPARVAGTLPSEWQGTGGWFINTGKTSESVIVVGDYTGYLEGIVFDAKGYEVKTPGTLVVVDGQGNRVYTSKQPDGFEMESSSLHRVRKDGKGYIVYVASGLTKENLTDPNKQDGSEGTSIVTVVNENGREVFSKTVQDKQRAFVGGDEFFIGNPTSLTHAADDDSIRITSSTAGKETLSDASQVMDVETGEITTVPTLSGYEWEGRFDGVDLFSNGEEIRSDSWVLKLSADNLSSFGKLVQTSNSKDMSGRILDPHTGKASSSLTPEKIAEVQEKLGTGDHIQVDAVSPNGRYVISNVAFASGAVVFDTEQDKIVYNRADVDFRPLMATDNGDTYGTGGNKNSSTKVNVLEGGDPKIEPEADLYPATVSASGLAAFSDDSNGTYFVVKK